MEQIISQEELDELMKIKGEVNGRGLKIDFILKKEGREGRKKMDEAIASLGLDFLPNQKEITKYKDYPVWLIVVYMLIGKRLFNWDDEKFQEMGKLTLRSPFIIRFFLRYFVSLEKIAKEAPKMWRTYFTVGDLKTVEYDEEKKYIVLRLENFRLHPLHCQFLKGFFSSALQMVIREEVSCEETKCVYRGDEYHEFLFKW
jgi:hypothetical protein